MSDPASPSLPSDAPVTFNVREVAQLLGVSRRVAYQIVREHGFRAGRKRLLITTAGLAEVVAKRVEPQPRRKPSKETP